MSSLSLSKYVLYVSDETLSLYKVASGSVAMLEQTPWRDPFFEKNVSAYLNRYVGDGSVIILNDTVEQHYRKEKISKLSPLDRQNIIKRKLAIAFPGYPTRAALQIKDPNKKGKKASEDNSKDHLFLFAAVPTSEAYRKLVEALRLSDCSVTSFSLLPVESAPMVQKIFDRLEKEALQQERAPWSVLITQQEGGGLRQIVVRNGQIALTRMTPVIIPDQSNGAQWASEVVQEFESTLSYLSRFGFNPADGIDVALAGPSEYVTLVGDVLGSSCNFYPLSVARAGELAGLKLGLDSTREKFGSVLHIAWAASKTKLVLPMSAKEVDAISKPRKSAFFGMLILLAAVGYAGHMAANEYVLTKQANQNLEIVKIKQQEAETIYQDEIKRKESLGIDINLIQGSLDVYKGIDREFFDPLPLLKVVGQELQELKIQSLDLITEFSDQPTTPDPAAAESQINAAAPIGSATLVLQFKFPGETKPQDGNQKMEELRLRLQTKLPDHKVEITKNLADLSFTGQLQNVTGVTEDSASKKEDYSAELTIKKDIHAQNSGS